MEKKVIFILILSLFCIVGYINFDNKLSEDVINLIYYCQYYVIVGLLITLLWILFTNKLLRALTCPITVYYIFHFIVNFIEIFNPELKDLIYRTRYINYGLSITLVLALIIIPLFGYIKQVVKKIIFKPKKNEGIYGS